MSEYTLIKDSANEILRVTPDGQFIWHPEADKLIEKGDFTSSPILHILRALRTKQKWVGLTDEEKREIYKQAEAEDWHDQPLLEAVEAKLKEKNYQEGEADKNIQS